MSGAPGRTYAAGMERDASVTSRLTLAPEPLGRRSVVRTCGTFTLRYLKAIADSCIQSGAYNPYWIGARPLAESHVDEARQR